MASIVEETKAVREKASLCHLVHYKSIWQYSEIGTGPRVGRVAIGHHKSSHGPKSDDPICDLERERETEERDLPIARSLPIKTKLSYSQLSVAPQSPRRREYITECIIKIDA
jgi:hypothetical protein